MEWRPSVTDASPSLVSSGGGAGVCLSCISVGADEKSREDQSETSAVLYATFNSFIYVLLFVSCFCFFVVLGHFELALPHSCTVFVSL